MKTPRITLLLLTLLLTPRIAFSQWNPDPAVNMPIWTGYGNQSFAGAASMNRLYLLSTATGNIICAWNNSIHGGATVQMIGPDGQLLWDSTRTLFRDSINRSFIERMISDVRGGAIAVFGIHDTCFVQRIDSNGHRRWGDNGIQLSSMKWSLTGPCIADDRGGIFIMYTCGGTSTIYLYAQHIDSSGAKCWGQEGALVCSISGSKNLADIIRDDRGGIICSWSDGRLSYPELFVQSIDSSGAPRWKVNGLPVCDFPRHRQDSRMLADGAGGMFLAWEEYRDLSYIPYRYSIFAQHIDSSGGRLWGDSGIVISDKFRLQGNPNIIGDAKGGAIISWVSHDTGYIACQRIDPQGNALWTRSGSFVADYHVRGALFSPSYQLVPDNMGGALLAYESYLWPDSVTIAFDIYAQRVDSNGIRLWPVEGKAVCTADSDQRYPNAVYDGTGGVFIVWMDARNGSDNTDIYGTRIDGSGNAYPVELISFIAALDGDRVALDWSTTAETNNFGFDIERSVVAGFPSDGRGGAGNLSDDRSVVEWKRIGFIPGYGSTVDAHAYHYDDALTEELERCDMLLYRLRQIEIDGSHTYSPVVRVSPSLTAGFSLAAPYPNPAAGRTVVDFETPGGLAVDIAVTSTLGAELIRRHAGVLPAGRHAVALDLSALPAGMYSLSVSAGGRTAVRTLLVNR